MSSSNTDSDNLDSWRTLQAVCEAAVKLMNVDHSGLVMFDSERKLGTVIAEYPTRLDPAIGMTVPVSGVPPAEALVKDGTPVVINDVENDSSLAATREILLKLGIKSIVIVPITLDGKVVGSFSFDSIKTKRQFESSDIEKCRSLAEFASLAVKGAQELNTLEPLRQAMIAIASAQEREPLLKTITAQAVNLLKADSGGIDDFDEVRQELSVVAAHNLPAEILGQKLKVGCGVAGRLIVSELDHMAVPYYKKWKHRAHYHGVSVLESVLGVPLTVENKRIGVLWVNAAEGRIFDQSDIKMLIRLAVAASIAFEKNISRDEERDHVHRLERLGAASLDILNRLATTGQKERLILIAKHAHTIMDAEACGILWVEQEGWLTMVASHGHKDLREDIPPFEIISGEGTGLTGYIASKGEVFRECGKALKNHPAVRHGGWDSSPSGQCYSLLAIPLKKQDGELVGLLRISNKKDKDGNPTEQTCFTYEDERIGKTFAEAVKIAIDTADLIDRANRGEARYRTVLEACEILTQAKLLDDGLKTLAQVVVDVLDKSFCRISLYNEDQKTLQVIAAERHRSKTGIQWNQRLGQITNISDWPGLEALFNAGVHRKLLKKDPEPNNLQQMADWIELRDADGKRLEIESMLTVPLKVGLRKVGLLIVGEVQTSRGFSNDEIDQALGISKQGSLLIENSQREKKLLTNFFEAERKINSSLDLDEVLSLVAKHVYEVAQQWGRGVNVVDINLLEGNKLSIAAAYPPDRFLQMKEMVGPNFDLITGGNGRIGIVGRAILNEKPLIENDARNHPDYFKIYEDTRSQMVVPIEDGAGKIIGAISVESRDFGAFDAQDQLLVQGLASQASSALQKDQQSRETERVRTIALTGAAGSVWQHELNPTSKRINNNLNRLERFSTCSEFDSELADLKRDAESIQHFKFTPLSEKHSEWQLLNPLVEARLRTYASYLRRPGSKLRVKPSLAATLGCQVKINAVWFGHALQQFLENAEEAITHANNKVIEIFTETPSRTHCQITIKNSGARIRDDVWEKLGNEQIRSENQPVEKGRGLLIARFILDVYGGKIEKINNEENNIVLGIRLPYEMRS